ncbi:Probable ATP-dependent Clp protease ATP-binding subunit [Slackia heliotrinireducens]|uniref:ATPase family protein associated with various cellular activities (AAA) n=1 Tax=Slackia heliotrinireducens (strain ATCC 29202 / DSM 20476 / NCTC 11029 / RHS 1) TaxID=471855 RepID=C7N6I1_SLAHD|nr:AAA family ATPase [Slackia heliotrinireducens]ACV22516.1 ATPase family protein associated with various cellular activities (AAA) [Slackia heliotrinireducens DSM 20476]VEH00947.1 Probable ATP-dependent Clp protease ATP-binding subunit [Slackia heliotrinireducens]
MFTTPQWQKEIENFVGIKSALIIEGNVFDLYPFLEGDDEDDIEFLTLNELLPRLFERGTAHAGESGRPYRFIYCDPLRGISNPLGDADLAAITKAAAKEADVLGRENESYNPNVGNDPNAQSRLVQNSLLLRAALTRRIDIPAMDNTPVACVYSFASRLTSRPSDLSAEENAVFLNLYLAVTEAIRVDGSNRNTLVLIVNKVADVPSWFFTNNPEVRSVIVPNPDRDTRAAFVDYAFSSLSDDNLEDVREKFIDVTDSMKVLELDELRRLRIKGDTSPEQFPELVDIYKYGLKENKWASIVDKLRDDPEEKLRRRVKGQDRALSKIVTVLKRSVMGFSGMQHSSGSKPKGVLFLAGPTGTGKTEVVKAVTELLFGDERSYLRFDMSEYASENSDQKLFGAPPGYVGYEEGGQLTNAVKANPFSVLLFDEVEKAHPSIMDKFLQILEDGRMTDGQGNTVYFSETLIFFTSNVGISEEILDEHGRAVGRRNIVEPGEPYEDIERKVSEAMAIHFKPEVLNRIGDNIVVFDYISPEASSLIARSQLKKINGNILKRHEIRVTPTDACLDWFCTHALDAPVREKGGRGIGNLIEANYLNPLSSYIFDARIEAGQTVVVDAVDDHVTFARGSADEVA